MYIRQQIVYIANIIFALIELQKFYIWNKYKTDSSLHEAGEPLSIFLLYANLIFSMKKENYHFMKLPSCVGETDQLLPGGPGSIKSHYDFLVYAKTSWLIVFFIEEKDIKNICIQLPISQWSKTKTI